METDPNVVSYKYIELIFFPVVYRVPPWSNEGDDERTTQIGAGIERR